jgi:hypothetical protein
MKLYEEKEPPTTTENILICQYILADEKKLD